MHGLMLEMSCQRKMHLEKLHGNQIVCKGKLRKGIGTPYGSGMKPIRLGKGRKINWNYMGSYEDCCAGGSK